jgi:hypothetical protein
MEKLYPGRVLDIILSPLTVDDFSILPDFLKRIHLLAFLDYPKETRLR